jgi:serine/threonine protein kinase
LIDIIGHKYLYSNGVLHRDISPGNILIEWHSGSEANKPSISGRLIDLDRGKRGNPYPSSSQVTATPADDSDERGKSCPSPSQATAAGAGDGDGDDSDNPHETFEWGSRRRLGSDVVHQALEFFPVRNQDNTPVMTYMTAAVQHALKFKHLTKGNICTVHNLQWKQVRP